MFAVNASVNSEGTVVSRNSNGKIRASGRETVRSITHQNTLQGIGGCGRGEGHSRRAVTSNLLLKIIESTLEEFSPRHSVGVVEGKFRVTS
jgi:hypothetical protein